jgi:hypothetical protein
MAKGPLSAGFLLRDGQTVGLRIFSQIGRWR